MVPHGICIYCAHESDYGGIVAECEDAYIGQVVGEEVLPPEYSFLVCTGRFAIAREIVNKDDAGGTKLVVGYVKRVHFTSPLCLGLVLSKWLAHILHHWRRDRGTSCTLSCEESGLSAFFRLN